MKDYLKFFQRPFYKMELPVIGKRADVCNKRAIMAICRGEEDVALKLWEEALNMKDQHLDTKLNYLIFQWRNAHISDEDLLTELSSEFFADKDIGVGLSGIINIATGERDSGLEILRKFISEEENKADQEVTLKAQRFKNMIKEIVDQVTLDKDQYFQNFRVKSDHKDKIESVNINVNSRYFTTASKDCVTVW